MSRGVKTYSKMPEKGEAKMRIPCPLCRGRSFRSRWSTDGAAFQTCRDCGLLVQNPQPIQDVLQARYDSEYFDYEKANEDAFFQLMMLGLKDAAFYERILPTLPPMRRILDIGCATGRLLKHFRDEGWETAGVELCQESASYGNRRYGVNIHAGVLESATHPDASFSVVHSSHVIEHVNNPAAFVAEISRLLMPGGVFICVTPSIDGLQARLFGPNWRSAIPDHLTLFSKATLRRLLVSSGLKVEKTCTWGGLAAGAAPPWLKRPFDRWAKLWGFGDVMLMASRKAPVSESVPG